MKLHRLKWQGTKETAIGMFGTLRIIHPIVQYTSSYAVSESSLTSYFSSLSTVTIRGVILRSSSVSCSVGVYPNLSSARSDRYSPAAPQAMMPRPTPTRALEERFLYALLCDVLLVFPLRRECVRRVQKANMRCFLL